MGFLYVLLSLHFSPGTGFGSSRAAADFDPVWWTVHLAAMQRAPSPRVEMGHVLSGGHLKGPCAVQTVVVSDLVFIELSVRDSAITRFLTGKRHQQMPLRHVAVIDRLLHLRNEATARKLQGEVDDLGVDAPKAKAPRRSDLQRLSPAIVEVEYEDGTELKLLGELGTRRVWMELTSGNMKFLFDQVSAEVDLRASAASSTKAKGTGSDASGSSEHEDSTTRPPSPKRSKGITWVGSRNTWVVRFKDEKGTLHSKRFRARAHAGDGCIRFKDAKVDALRLAEEWLEEHHAALT